MPIDPLHQRRIPSGQRLARVLASALRAMHAAAASAARRGRVADLDGFTPALVQAVLPILGHEYHLGRQPAARDVRMRDARGGRTVGHRATGLSDRGAAAPAHGQTTTGAVAGRAGVATVARQATRRPLVVKAGSPFGPGGSADPESVPGVSFALFGPGVPLAVQSLVLALAGSITDTLRDDVRRVLLGGLEAGKPVAAIANGLAPLFGPQRAWTIAATESSRAMHAGQADYAREAGAAGLEWLASADACPACLNLNGKRVRFGEPFVVHRSGRAAYRQVMHPPAHPSCFCSTTTWWAEDERRVTR